MCCRLEYCVCIGLIVCPVSEQYGMYVFCVSICIYYVRICKIYVCSNYLYCCFGGLFEMSSAYETK